MDRLRLSGRVPRDYAPNRFYELLARKRSEGARLLDLTGTNPTHAGLPGLGPHDLAALADGRAARYDPDPRGLLQAREAIASYYGSRGAGAESTAVDPSRLLITSSTSEAYAHLFRLLCEPGEEILVPRPSYPLIEPIAKLESIELRDYRLAFDSRWTLDRDSVESAVTPRTRALVVIEPNNPTGSCLAPPERDWIESFCEERRIAIISDEVFSDFPWAPDALPLRSWLGARRVPTFVLNGISKLCGLPQMKLAWIAVAGPEPVVHDALHGLEWIADLFLSVGSPVQLALPRLLERRGGFHAAATERIAESLAILRAKATGPAAFEILGADGGWSAVLRLAPAAGEDPAEWALANHDVVLHPAEFYDLPCAEDVVVSLLTEPSMMAEAVGRIRNGWGRNPHVE